VKLAASAKLQAAAWSADGRWVATFNDDGRLRVWDAGGAELASLETGTSDHADLSFSPNAAQVAIYFNYRGDVILWNWRDGTTLSLAEHAGSIHDVAYSADGTRLATAGFDATAKLWDTQSGTLLASFDESPNWLGAVSFSPDGRSVLIGGAPGLIWQWQIGALETRTPAQIQARLRCAAPWRLEHGRIVSASLCTEDRKAHD
jgi:WD40 repeat protein